MLTTTPSPSDTWVARLTGRVRHVSWPLLRTFALAGAGGGSVGWILGEVIDRRDASAPVLSVYLAVFVYFFVISAAIGLALGAVPGLLDHAKRRIIRGGVAGALVGGLGGGLGALPAQFAYSALGEGLLGRAIGWAIVGAAIGLCPGIAARDYRRSRRGILGGLIGGFVGGMLFDVVGWFVNGSILSRGIADLALGLCIGLMVAFVESMLKTAWLTVLSGKREGAQFILSKDTTTLGRDDRDDILLWGDTGLEPHHARFIRLRRAFALEDAATGAHTTLNDRAVSGRQPLHDRDEIMVGSTRLLYQTQGAPRVAPQPPPVSLPEDRPVVASRSIRHAHATDRSLLAVTRPQRHSAAPTAPVPQAPSDLRERDTIQGGGRETRIPRFSLVRVDTGQATVLFRSAEGIVIGRDPTCDIVVEDAAVSSQHARLLWQDAHWIVRDLMSTNGTFVNYSGLDGGERQIRENALRPGSRLRVGQTTFHVTVPSL